jgi:hypothetical protein
MVMMVLLGCKRSGQNAVGGIPGFPCGDDADGGPAPHRALVFADPASDAFSGIHVGLLEVNHDIKLITGFREQLPGTALKAD